MDNPLLREEHTENSLSVKVIRQVVPLLMQAHPDEMKASVDRAFEILGDAFDLDRIVLRTGAQDVSSAPLHSWVRREEMEHPERISSAALQWVFTKVSEAGCLAISHPSELPEEASDLIELLVRTGTHSILFVPIKVNGITSGVAHFATVGRSIDWSDLLIDTLHLVADLVGSAYVGSRNQLALHQSEVKFRRLFESSGDGLLLIRDGVLIDCNERICEITGYTREELVRMSVADVSQGTLRDGRSSRALARELMQIAATGATVQTEWQLRQKSGALLEIIGSLVPVEIDGIECIYASIRDNSKHYASLRTIRENSTYLEAMFSVAGLSFSVMELVGDGQFAFVDASPGFLELNGTTRDKVVGRSLEEAMIPLVGPESTERIRLTCAHCVRKGKPMNIRSVFRTNGRDIYWHTDLTPVRNDQGEVTRIIVVGVEFNELAIAEKTLREQNDYLQSIYQDSTSAFGVLSVIEGNRFEYADVNRFWLETNGFSVGEIIGRSPTELVPTIAAESADRITMRCMQCVEKRESMTFTETINSKGEDRHWYTTLTPSVNDKGEVARIIFNSIYVSPLVQAEERLQSALVEITRLKNQLEEENSYLRDEVRHVQGFSDIIGTSPALRSCMRQVEMVAPLNTTVLILGETGTGKELVARNIHDLSNRRNEPMVSVNCAALPAELIESEMFGHEKGAFTGAHQKRLGRLELAGAGTLFLDEIGDLRLDLQAKLLRVLQEGVFERVGGTTTLRFKARIIAATNRDLASAIEAGAFRQDLYYRLNVFPIEVPPLRERGSDTQLLAEHFARRAAISLKRTYGGFSEKFRRFLATYSFPGNVRELQNLIERAVIVSTGPLIDLPTEHFAPDASGTPMPDELRVVERRHIEQVLDKTNWRIEGDQGAASVLGLAASTLRYRMSRLGIRRPGR